MVTIEKAGAQTAFRASLTLLACLVTTPLMGQWLNHPTPGIPRAADGKPNLTAPAPRTPDGTPDVSGIWHRSADRYYNNIAADLKPADVLSWADAVYQRRKTEFGRDSMEVRCLPMGPAASTTPYRDIKIVQTPGLIVVLLSDLTYRQIYMDGRQLQPDPNPNWMGYSVGRWDGDTLVVESNGFTDRSWLDYDGHPHTEALRMTERFHRVDLGHLDLEVTLEDLGAYTRRWSVAVPLELFADTELLEEVCNENEKDVSHMPDSQPGSVEVKVAHEILAKYVGTYEVHDKEQVRLAVVSLSDDVLILDVSADGPQPLVPITEITFSRSGDVIHFVADDNGAISHILIKTVEGEDKAVRKP